MAKLSHDGKRLLYSSYLSGTEQTWENVNNIIYSTEGDLYVCSSTDASDMPVTADALSPQIQGERDIFITVLDKTLTVIKYATYFGGRSHDNAVIKLDSLGNIIGVGASNSSDFPMTPDAYDNSKSGNSDIILFKLSPVDSPDPNGPIENQRSGQRFNSIQCAINYASENDVIIIEPGIYEESIVTDKNVVLQSLDPNDPYTIGGTIIQGDADSPVLTLSDTTEACTIAGLTLRAGSVGVSGSATNATLRNCRIMDNVSHGLELFSESHPCLDHCLVSANGETGITMHPGAGRRKPPCMPQFVNCYIVDNSNLSIVGGQPVIVDSLIQ
ncbi:right-handed parallel beta-helix repeat-containing protein [Planctomycetota bacterium]